ncbi:ABC transporter permease [Actinosynnema sp. NPDC047251]|uniref:ABC-type dipeptide transporter, permease subunit n=1 Tax=Saccharothrix espanaensis (strain ATCC 51144 / DSM 44229 / JCM 9112 / NBRC 15066 / NRRL 15764) TaxID=1179773 RepID=K0JVZ2_SACES|nr:ABC transporter permease [Saccharothrix espanaensis]CCH32010.1 ABC-type dipeptide transporter, permease subunit [Saccharothrix espanaensis DSM 44229]
MIRPLLRGAANRVLAALAVLLGAASLAFAALQLIPGDPVAIILGPATQASAQVQQAIRAEYGLDQPVVVQYLHYVGRLATGDLGRSYQLQRPVVDLIADQAGPTAALALAALVLAAAVSVGSAIGAAGRGRVAKGLASGWELLAVSSPPYWVGILLLSAFSFSLRWFPVSGAQDLSALVLPALTLALPVAGVLSQVLREGLEAALAEPFSVTARARGLSRTAVRARHALRHAAIPLVTLAGWLTGSLLGGAVLVEAVFGRPGIGALTLQAVTNKDMPLVIGLVLLSALVFVVISTLVDLLYLAVDPRLRTR